jgi:hypothetical protein
MAKKTETKSVSKTGIIEELARRPQGVTGVEIIEATGWPSGSAKWRVGALAERLGCDFEQVERDGREVGYRLLDAKKATAKAKASKAPASKPAPKSAKSAKAAPRATSKAPPPAKKPTRKAA